jgi:MFS transporter, ACS family, pantothenate transporter
MAEIPEAVSWTPPAVDNENEKRQLGNSISKTHEDSQSSQASYSHNPWEEPGFKRKVHRTWRNVQRYIWDDPDKPAIENKYALRSPLLNGRR